MRGFPARILEEMKKRWTGETKIKLLAPSERELSSWIGGAVVASMDEFKNNWITKAEYSETGKQIVHMRTI